MTTDCIKPIHEETLMVLEKNPGVNPRQISEFFGISRNAADKRLRLMVRHDIAKVVRDRNGRVRYYAMDAETETDAEFEVRHKYQSVKLRSKAESLGWFDPNRYRQPEARA